MILFSILALKKPALSADGQTPSFEAGLQRYEQFFNLQIFCAKILKKLFLKNFARPRFSNGDAKVVFNF